MAKIEETVEKLVKPKIENLGYTLYDVLFVKEGPNQILRIVIDSKNGISLEDCEKVNNEIKDDIDELDPIKEQYFLEVSSTGIERLLRKDWQLKEAIGEEVDVKLFKKDEEGQKEHIGTLLEVQENYLTLENTTGENNIQIDRKNISQIKTVYND